MGSLAKNKVPFNRGDENGEKIARTTIDKGGGDTASPYHMQPLGDDSQPLENDTAALIDTQRTGGKASVAWNDPKNEGIAKPGEKRMYGRNTLGDIVGSVHFQNDGTINISNVGGASIVLGSDGTVKINGIDWDTHIHGNGAMQAGGDAVTGDMGGAE